MLQRITRVPIIVLMITLLLMHTATPLIAGEINLPGGTVVQLELIDTISSETHAAGQPIQLRVVSDVTVDGAVVIAAGALADGKVISASKKGAVGKPGALGIQITSVVAVDGSTVPVTATRLIEGENKTTTAIVLTLLCIFGLLMKGGDATFQAGSVFEASTLSEKTVNID